MKVVFPFMGQPNLGIESLSAMLKYHGHETYLAFDPSLFDDKFYLAFPKIARYFSVKERMIREIIELKPDILAFSVFSTGLQWALEVAAEIRSVMPVKTVFGGPHATETPEYTLRHPEVDYVCKAEGEHALLELVERLEAGLPTDSIPNLWYKYPDGSIKENTVRPVDHESFDALPPLDKTLFEPFADYKSQLGYMTARGCPYQCTFCSSPILKDSYKEVGSKSIRFRSIPKVIEELKEYKEKYGVTHIHFYDDVFTSKVDRLIEFSKAYQKEIGISYYVSTHPQMLSDRILKELKESGCQSLQLGIESMSEHVRSYILKRAESDAVIDKTMAMCEKYGITLLLDHIFGFPTEPQSSQDYAFKRYLKWKPGRIQTYWLTLHPGTQIVKILKEMGRITDEEIEKLRNGFVENFHEYGIVSDPEERKRYQSYHVLFKLIPLLPRPVLVWIKRSPLFSLLRFFPLSIVMAVDTLGAIRNGIPVHRNYLMYYVKNLKHVLKRAPLVHASTYRHRLEKTPSAIQKEPEVVASHPA